VSALADEIDSEVAQWIFGEPVRFYRQRWQRDISAERGGNWRKIPRYSTDIRKALEALHFVMPPLDVEMKHSLGACGKGWRVSVTNRSSAVIGSATFQNPAWAICCALVRWAKAKDAEGGGG
jgi:hypothetical protein